MVFFFFFFEVLIDKEDYDFVGWMPADDLTVYSFDS